MNTRYALPGANPDDSPERHLASSKVRGLAIGMNIVARIARVLPEPEKRAMIWLTNYAKLLDLTQDSLSTELGLDPRDIRSSLTDPDFNRHAFVDAVARMRSVFEAGLKVNREKRQYIPPFKSRVFREAYCALANTKIRRKVANAVKFAEGDPQIVEVIGETRLGKTVAAAWEYFHRLDHAAWFTIPKSTDERSFMIGFAAALGCSVGTCEKNSGLSVKIESCIGPGLISLVFADEAHRNWPADPKLQPKRLDHWRDWWEYHSLSSLHLATPQFTNRMQGVLAAGDGKWEIGQWIGRVQCFDLPNFLDDGDLSAIARNHLPEADAATLAQLVSHAKASRGYAGVMVKAIERARFKLKAKEDDEAPGTMLKAVIDSQKQIDRETIKEALAQLEAAKGKRARVIEMGVAA